MKRTATIFIADALSFMTTAQNRFTVACQKADSLFNLTKRHQEMECYINQTLNNYAVHMSPKKHATATADYLLDNGFAVTQIIMYTATDSAIIIIYVPGKGTKNAETVKAKIKATLEKWNPAD